MDHRYQRLGGSAAAAPPDARLSDCRLPCRLPPTVVVATGRAVAEEPWGVVSTESSAIRRNRSLAGGGSNEGFGKRRETGSLGARFCDFLDNGSAATSSYLLPLVNLPFLHPGINGKADGTNAQKSECRRFRGGCEEECVGLPAKIAVAYDLSLVNPWPSLRQATIQNQKG